MPYTANFMAQFYLPTRPIFAKGEMVLSTSHMEDHVNKANCVHMVKLTCLFQMSSVVLGTLLPLYLMAAVHVSHALLRVPAQWMGVSSVPALLVISGALWRHQMNHAQVIMISIPLSPALPPPLSPSCLPSPHLP